MKASNHEFVKIEIVKLLGISPYLLFCYKKKEAFTNPGGFRFCPACGSDLGELCREDMKKLIQASS